MQASNVCCRENILYRLNHCFITCLLYLSFCENKIKIFKVLKLYTDSDLFRLNPDFFSNLCEALTFTCCHVWSNFDVMPKFTELCKCTVNLGPILCGSKITQICHRKNTDFESKKEKSWKLIIAKQLHLIRLLKFLVEKI